MAKHEISCSWEGSKLLFSAKDIEGHNLYMDTAVAYGGENKGFSPMQLLLVALAGCMGMSIKSVLNKNKANLDSFDLNVIGEIDTQKKPSIYKGIKVIITAKGDIDKKTIEDAIVLSENKYCHVSAMLSELVDIEYEIVIQ